METIQAIAVIWSILGFFIFLVILAGISWVSTKQPEDLPDKKYAVLVVIGGPFVWGVHAVGLSVAIALWCAEKVYTLLNIKKFFLWFTE